MCAGALSNLNIMKKNPAMAVLLIGITSLSNCQWSQQSIGLDWVHGSTSDYSFFFDPIHLLCFNFFRLILSDNRRYKLSLLYSQAFRF